MGNPIGSNRASDRGSPAVPVAPSAPASFLGGSTGTGTVYARLDDYTGTGCRSADYCDETKLDRFRHPAEDYRSALRIIKIEFEKSRKIDCELVAGDQHGPK